MLAKGQMRVCVFIKKRKAFVVRKEAGEILLHQLNTSTELSTEEYLTIEQ